jgi:flagellar motility protein MotE (MotC chaperone)
MNAKVVFILAVGLGSIFGAGSGLYWFSLRAGALLEQHRHQRVEAIEAARPTRPWDFWTLEIEALVKDLTQQREELDARQSTVEAREQRLHEEYREVEVLRREVESLRRDIDRRMTIIHANEQRNLRNLAASYSLLSPAAAIAIFNELDDVTVTKLLAVMKPETTAALLSAMSAQPGANGQNLRRAALLSQRLRLIHLETNTP